MKGLIVLIFVLACVQAQDYCPRGESGVEVYDQVGRFSPTTDFSVAVGIAATCPKYELHTRVLQLFTPPSLPWIFTHLCIAVRSTASSTLQTFSVEMYNTNPDYSVGNLIATFYSTSTIKTGDLYTLSFNLSSSFVARRPHVYLGVSFKQCTQNAVASKIVLGATIGAKFQHRLSKWVPNDPDSAMPTWETIPATTAVSVAIRTRGHLATGLAKPTSWTCLESRYTDSICDCNCGEFDPYCLVNSATSSCGSTNSKCLSNGTCINPGWNICDINKFDARDGCDCCNGTFQDPDCYDPYQQLLCDGLPASNCASKVCTKANWTCSPTKFHDGKCDCGCGSPDIDCSDSSKTTSCSSNRICSFVDGTCWLPQTWNCSYLLYGDGSICNCECGAYDIDCKTSTTVVGCNINNGYVCNNIGSCVLYDSTINQIISSSGNPNQNSLIPGSSTNKNYEDYDNSSSIDFISNNSNGNQISFIIIIVPIAGGVVLIALAVIIICAIVKHKKKNKNKHDVSGTEEGNKVEMQKPKEKEHEKPIPTPITPPPVVATSITSTTETKEEKPKKKKSSSSVRQSRRGNKACRMSFRMPKNRESSVVEDAAGNPLFLSWGADGKPIVKDLGGNVIDVELNEDEEGRCIAVYNGIAPPSTERKQPTPEVQKPVVNTQEASQRAPTPKSPSPDIE